MHHLFTSFQFRRHWIDALRRFSLFYVFALCSLSQVWATEYYVSTSGNDNNTGLTTGTPWQSLGKVNGRSFSPGDKIHFKGGDNFSGPLYPWSSGAANNPITYDSYGTGVAILTNPSGVISFNNASYETFKNLKLVGVTDNSTGTGTGVGFNLYSSQRVNGISLINVEASGFSSGILVGGSQAGAGVDGLLIDGCSAHDNITAGIMVWGMDWNNPTTNANVTIRNTIVYKNIGIGNTKVPHSGSGIVVYATNGCLIEKCVARDNGDPGGGAYGIWDFASSHVTIQYCEAYNNKAPILGDGGGFDLDGATTDSVVQYCYSHDNDGAGYLACTYGSGQPWVNNVIRYNISKNNGRTRLANSAEIYCYASSATDSLNNLKVYNNTAFCATASSMKPTCLGIGSGGSVDFSGVQIRNNVFIAGNGRAIVGTMGNITQPPKIQNNLYYAMPGTSISFGWYGNTYASLAAFQSATGEEKNGTTLLGVQADPQLPDQSTTVTLATTVADCATLDAKIKAMLNFKPASSSPVIDAGLDLTSATWGGYNVGNQDITGAAIPQGAGFDIGAIDQSRALNKLSGTLIGTPGTYGGGNTIAMAFDGNTSTFYDAAAPGTDTWAGLDLGASVAAQVTKIRFYPRASFASRMTGCKFQGSNDPTFASRTDLYTISSTPADAWTEVSITNAGSFRYLRYLSVGANYGNVAEVEFYGVPGAPQVPTITSLSPSSGSTAGSTTVTISGANLAGASVAFGGIAATSVTVLSSNTVTCVTPAHAAGTVNVVLATPGGQTTSGSGYTYVTPTYNITASAGTGGSISLSGTVSVNSGSNQSFTITPNSGYQISGVTVDGGSVGTASTYTFSNVTASHTIAATFSATSLPGIVNLGIVNLGIVNPGFELNDLGNSYGNNKTQLGFDAGGVGSATNSQGWLNAGGMYTNSGISWTTGVDFPHSGTNEGYCRGGDSGAYQIISYQIKSGDVLTLSWWAENSWNVGCSTVQLMGATASNTAFTSLTSLASRSDTIGSPNVAGTAYTQYTLTYTAQASDVGKYVAIAFNNTASNMTFVAFDDFALSVSQATSSYNITASAGTNGSISPSGSVLVSSGSSKTFTITPNSGYQISGVTVDGGSVGTASTYTFSNVTASHTIAATFSGPSVLDIVNPGFELNDLGNSYGNNKTQLGFDAGGVGSATNSQGWLNAGGMYTNSGISWTTGVDFPHSGTNEGYCRGGDSGAYQIISYQIKSGDVLTLSWWAENSWNVGCSTVQLMGATASNTAFTSLTSLASRSDTIGSPNVAGTAYTQYALTYTAQASDVGKYVAIAFNNTASNMTFVGFDDFALSVVSSKVSALKTASLVPSPTQTYAAWSTAGQSFNAVNSEGIAYGLAWILGADTPSVNSIGLMPQPSNVAGALTMQFSCLKPSNMGTATLAVQYGSDLSSAATWPTVSVPDVGSYPGTAVDFDVITDPNNPNLNQVVATIHAGATGGQLFARLIATGN